MSWVYMNTLQTFYTETPDYLNAMNTVFPFLAMKYSSELTQGNLLQLILEKCLQYTD